MFIFLFAVLKFFFFPDFLAALFSNVPNRLIK
jgi:hypothetical protein